MALLPYYSSPLRPDIKPIRVVKGSVVYRLEPALCRILTRYSAARTQALLRNYQMFVSALIMCNPARKKLQSNTDRKDIKFYKKKNIYKDIFIYIEKSENIYFQLVLIFNSV